MSTSEWAVDSGYGPMIERAKHDNAYRQGLLDAARVARAQGQTPDAPPCPSDMAAVYIERIANGEQP